VCHHIYRDRVRTVLLANNRLGARIARYLEARGDLDALVLHPENRRLYGDELTAVGADTYTWPDGLDTFRAQPPECVLSVLFAFKVPPEWLALPTWRACNLHPALLPYNRGAAPNVWPLVDGSPAGTTLHVMEAAIDTGAILSQRAVPTFPDDTAYTLYQRLEDASFEMFEAVWPDLRACEPMPQPAEGTTHRLRDLATLDLTQGDFPTLDKLRARTFGEYGAEFERDGHRYRARVQIDPLD
jgi:methionyl-tRNA formyltransferase